MRRAPRDEVAHTVVTEPGRIRRGSAVGVLALLAASALVPVATAVAGGGAIATALAAVGGNIGSGYLSDLIQRAAGRLRHGGTKLPEPEGVRDALAADLRDALEKRDTAAWELSAELMSLLMKIEGFEAAVAAAGDDLRRHLLECFALLAEQHRTTLSAIHDIDTEQRRQGRHLRRQTPLIEEMADRLRWLTREVSSAARPDTSPARPPAPETVVVASGGTTAAPPAPEWCAGADVVVGDLVYILYDRLVDERISADQALVRRRGQGRRLVPEGMTEDRYAWLRQVETRRDTPAARAALASLSRENDLLGSLRAVPGLPRGRRLVTEGLTSTLVLVWPVSRSTGMPCESLDVFLDRGDGVPLDPWRLSRLCGGLAGLCRTLAGLHGHGVSHRSLTPDEIIMLDNGTLLLRDLGLAPRDPGPGEGPVDYQAPEQRRRRGGRPGPGTDVYQVGAVAHHLVTGRPPHPTAPPPLRAQAREVPERLARAVDAALATDPAERPGIRDLAAALRTVRDDPR